MASEAEGFICPYCLIGFASGGKLQAHFVDLHSEEVMEPEVTVGDDGDEWEEEDRAVNGPLGHRLRVRRLTKPCSCHVCGEIIWQDTLTCQDCGLRIHMDKCQDQLETACSAPDEVDSGINGQRAPVPQGPKGILPLVRRQIAKGRDRYVNEEFDLDLTYITERIIAMSYPASGVESTYRNNLKDVAKMLRTKHQENYMIFNLSERSYDISKFNNQVLDFGWPDHLAPSLERLSSVCKSMKSWLDSDPQHVAVVHCKGGKGRTGCVIAAFMHYSSICESAQEALDRFAMKRFYDSKVSGVTQPSQRKYVHYFADLLAGRVDLHSPPVVLNHVIIHGIPNFDGKGGCRPFLKFYENMKLVHTSGLYVCPADKGRVKISMYRGLKLQGEVLVKCFHKKTHAGMEAIFRTQFHTAVVRDSHRILLQKADLDDAFKDKRFPEGAKVELIFESWDHADAGSAGNTADIRSSLLDSKTPSTSLLGEIESANRDSYANFQGGFDSGRPDSEPDLISFSQPEHQPSSEGSLAESFKMDPDLIKRVAPHPQSEQLYTVVSKPLKAENRHPAKGTTSPVAEGGREISPPLRPMPPTKPPPPTKVLNKIAQPRGKPARPLLPPSRAGKVSNPPPSCKPPPPPTTSPSPPPQSKSASGHDEPDYADVDEEEEALHESTQQTKLDQQDKPVKAFNVTRPLKKPVQPLPYDEVTPNMPILIEPVPPRQSAGALDEVWGKFKFQTMPYVRPDSLSRRSSSSSNLTTGSSSEYYSNLADLQIGSAFVGETQRRHSFSGEEKIVIKGTAGRESIIPVNTVGLDEPEYKNIGLGGFGGSDDALYKSGGQQPRAKVGRINYVNTPIVNGRGGQADDELVYENQDPEGLFHIYTNENDLMEQVRQLHRPVPETADLEATGDGSSQEEVESSVHLSFGRAAAFFKLLRPTLSFGKPKHSEIHSAKISEEDRQLTLAPFALSGISAKRVNRDYEAFFRSSAWGDGVPAPQKPGDLTVVHDPREGGPPRREGGGGPGREGGAEGKAPSPQPQRRQKKLPRVPASSQLSPPDAPLPHPPLLPSPHPPLLPSPRHPPLQKKPSAPLPVPRLAHDKLHPTSSVDIPRPRDAGHGRLPQPPAPSNMPVKKRVPPPKPPPYYQELRKPPSDSSVRANMPYWYRPAITREEAIEYVRHLDPGGFIVRDSQTVSGGYALTIKISEEQVRQRRKMTDGTPVTEDMCVTHFLIQPDPDGVKLQGWSERAFKTLPEFIAQHTVEKLCLPCKLVLPKGSPGHLIRRKPATMKQALVTGCACDLVYLGSVDVSSPGSEPLLAETVQLFKTLELSTMNVVTFKASRDGITLTDNVNGMYIKRQYPITSVTYCGLDPNDTRWDFPSLQHQGNSVTLVNKPCFGVIHRLHDDTGYSCLLFAEYDPGQPVTSVVKYVQRTMKQRDLK